MKRYDFFCMASRAMLRSMFRIEVHGLENVPEKGAFILAPNHISFLDPLAAGAFVGRDVYYMARESLFRIPGLGRVITWCNAFPVKRDSPGAGAMRTALAVLKGGGGLLVFPEGRRSPDGSLGEGNPGVALLSRVSGAPIVPVLIRGTDKALPVDARCVRFAKVVVHYMEPVDPPGSSSREDYARTAEEVMQSIRQKLREVESCPAK